MAPLTKSSRPILVADSPQFSSLAQGWPYAAGGGPLTEILSGAQSTPTGGPIWETSPYGPCRTYVAGSTQYDALGNIAALSGVSAFTLSVLIRRTGSGNGMYASQGNTGNNRTGILLHTDGVLYALMGNGGNIYGALTFAASTWQLVTVTYDGSQSTDATRLQIYLWGVPQTITTFNGTIPATTSATGASFHTGRDEGGPFLATGSCGGVWVWSKWMNVVQVAGHAADIWGLYTVPSLRHDVMYGAGPLSFEPSPTPTAIASNRVPAAGATLQSALPTIHVDWTPRDVLNPVTAVTISVNGVSYSTTTSAIGGGALRATAVGIAANNALFTVKSVATTQDGNINTDTWTASTRRSRFVPVMVDEYVRGSTATSERTDWALKAFVPSVALTDYVVRPAGIIATDVPERVDYSPQDVLTGLLNSTNERTDVLVVTQERASLINTGTNIGQFNQSRIPIGMLMQGTERAPILTGANVSGTSRAMLLPAGAEISQFTRAPLLAVGCAIAQFGQSHFPTGCRIDPVFASALLEYVVRSTALQDVETEP